jgi:type I restriction enzyme S subunit
MKWRTMPLDAIKAPVPYAFIGGPFGSNLTTRDYFDEGVPVIRGNNLPADASFRDDDFVFVSEKKADDLRSNAAFPGDLIFTQRGTLGQVGLIPSDSRFQRYIVSQSQMKLTVDPAIAVPRFVYYFFRLPATVQKVVNHALTSGVPHINLGILKGFGITIPEVDAQQWIVGTLSAYDDLIENNRRRMALLEEAARQLYREWFVRLRFPGHEHSRITNGLPEGWERRTFTEACSSLEDGDWIETKDQGGDDYRLLQISNIGINEFVETGNFRYVTEQTFKRLNCRELLPGRILIARMPKPIGRAWLVTEMPWHMITAVDAAIAVPNEELADPYFLTHYLNSPASLEHCERRAVGATRPRIARRELAGLPLLLPPRRLQTHFREIAEPLNQQRAVLYRQNEKLRAARDLLLPRLMSGEITA